MKYPEKIVRNRSRTFKNLEHFVENFEIVMDKSNFFFDI